MKKALFILFVMMFAVGMAAAQQYTGDILGAHNVNGHGCASCHAPHTGAAGNGGTNTASGENYLWGRDFVARTYTLNSTDSTGANLTLQVTNTGSTGGPNDPSFHTAACLSCHDGSAAIAGMTGTSKEYISGGFYVTTYLNDGSESLKNDHPVDVPYDPTSSYNWPGTVDATNGVVTWTQTTASNAFQANYGRPFRLYAGNGRNGWASYVECSTCHNPHSENWSKSTYQSAKNTVKPTNFFVRGWYNTDNAASNSGQQFCRSCHYSKSNEYVNQYTIPTT